MIGALICGYNLFCHIDNIKSEYMRPKYPPDVAQLCQYFEDQKSELPDYCKWNDKPFTPRRRSEF
jgi:hypothetical protein